MKKVIIAIPALLILTGARAQVQDKAEPLIDRSFLFDALHICATLLVLYIALNFILELLQRNLDHRIKGKVIEAGTPESMVGRLLSEKKKDMRGNILLWLCVLLAMGLGLSIIDLTLPFGLHSVAILAFSIGIGLLVFYIISGRRQRKASHAGEGPHQ